MGARFEAEPDGAADTAGRGVGGGEHDTRCVAFARELGQTHPVYAREWWRAVEHDEGEDAAAQQQVGAPSAATTIARAHHDEPVAQPCEGGRGQCAPRINPRHPAAGAQDSRDDLTEQGGLAGGQRTDHLRDPPAGNATTHRGIQRGNARGPRTARSSPPGDHRLQSGAERRHSRWRRRPFGEVGHGIRHERGGRGDARRVCGEVRVRKGEGGHGSVDGG